MPGVSVRSKKKNFFRNGNYNFDDDVLLKWEITGTGRCVGSYSHFNSMMKRPMEAEQSDNDW